MTLGEGRTPLVRREIAGQDVAFKLDYLQPSGSFKDRGASVLMTLVKFLGVEQIVEDSSGNAGAAMAAYAAAAGIGCTIYSPDYTPDGKLVQIRLYGAWVEKVSGTRQDTNDAAIRAAATSLYASHLWNPFFGQGLATAAYEIWEQMGGRVPPAVIVPIGSGGYLEGLAIGFRALVRAGYAAEMPRLIGVQADHCAPLHLAWSAAWLITQPSSRSRPSPRGSPSSARHTQRRSWRQFARAEAARLGSVRTKSSTPRKPSSASASSPSRPPPRRWPAGASWTQPSGTAPC